MSADPNVSGSEPLSAASSRMTDGSFSGQTALMVFDNVCRVYPRGFVTALHKITFAIRAGEHTSITGPSGSGKSTLLYLAGGLDRPTSGRVLFDGWEPKTSVQWAKLRARRIGFVFQSFQLIGGLTAAENVEIAMFGVVPSERDRRKRVAELLDRVRLAHRREHRVSDLSGGESQRVAIARALANSPDLILADEPTGNLDSRNAGEICELLSDLRRQENVALLVVTHDPDVAQQAGRVIRLLDGQVVADVREGGGV
jgi:ABC-type lipoprotein export system ATPase subunit